MLPFSASQSGIQQHSSIMYHHSTIIENYEKRCIHDPGLTSHSFLPAARETKDQFKTLNIHQDGFWLHLYHHVRGLGLYE